MINLGLLLNVTDILDIIVPNYSFICKYVALHWSSLNFQEATIPRATKFINLKSRIYISQNGNWKRKVNKLD